jgi:DHA1 family tetracycline resistance protein-like MFS transporter
MMSLWGVSGAAIQSIMTKRVAADQQGQLQGANASVQSISQLLGPSLFTLTFAYFIGAQTPLHLPGAPFFLASVLVLTALGVAVRTVSGGRSGGR